MVHCQPRQRASPAVKKAQVEQAETEQAEAEQAMDAVLRKFGIEGQTAASGADQLAYSKTMAAAAAAEARRAAMFEEADMEHQEEEGNQDEEDGKQHGGGDGATVAAVVAIPDTFISTVSIPYGSLVVYLVIAGIAGIVAAILPARRAARLNVLDAISHE